MNKKISLVLIITLVLAVILPLIVGGQEPTGYYLTDWVRNKDNPLLDPSDDRVWSTVTYSNGTFHLYLGHYSNGSDIAHWSADVGLDFEECKNSPIITRADVQSAWKLKDTPIALEPHSIVWWEGSWRLYFGAKVLHYYSINNSRMKYTWWIGYAVSKDLDTWELGSNPCLKPTKNEASVADPHAVVYNDKIYLYYAATGIARGDEIYWKLCGAWSDDGDNFTKFGGGVTCLIFGAAPGEFIALEGGIAGLIINTTAENRHILAVWTQNGQNFSYYSGNPVISPSADNSWESVGVGHISICSVDETFYGFYVGRDSEDNCRLGGVSTISVAREIEWGKDD